MVIIEVVFSGGLKKGVISRNKKEPVAERGGHGEVVRSVRCGQ